ncbi:MAG: HAMP domain-containing histidine kinase [Reichenbachiella sp.]
MNKSKNTKIFILVVILITIVNQVYWQIGNYDTEKSKFVKDAQLPFNSAIVDYYKLMLKRNQKVVIVDPFNEADVLKMMELREGFELRTFYKLETEFLDHFESEVVVDARTLEQNEEIKDLLKGKFEKESLHAIQDSLNTLKAKTTPPRRHSSVGTSDGHRNYEYEITYSLDNILMFSLFEEDIVNVSLLDSLLQIRFDEAGIASNHAIVYTFEEEYICSSKEVDETNEAIVKISCAEKYFSDPSVLEIHHYGAFENIIKRNIASYLSSVFFTLLILALTIYLLKIINELKQISQMKDDLISNVTHEFKTPIATITTALEGIEKFNDDNDKEKNLRYLGLANQQLSRLDFMVERLLETAALDKNDLLLKKGNHDLSMMVVKIIENYQLLTNKKIELQITPELYYHMDINHFHNAVSNLIDNAIKYGDDYLLVELIKTNSSIELRVSNDGTAIPKLEHQRIFEKFYRIQKGDIHDTKGHGIGLYYSQKVIHGHGGRLDLTSNDQLTTFKTTLPL